MTEEDNPLLNYFVRNGQAGMHKWLDYFEVYHRTLARYRGRPITFLEIGVQNGGSTRMWREYFGPQATIIGVDIDPACRRLEEEGFEIWIGDQSDPAFWEEFCESHPALDVVLDDGGHTMRQQIVTFDALFPRLREFGTYLCEDTHTSYFPSHGGGEGVLTFHEHIKSLVDEMHAWYHVPLAELPREYWARNLYAISFFDSIVTLEKRSRNPPITLARGSFGHVENPLAMSFLDMRRACGVKD
ncbi:class I SAM-dependent methyltransferase [Piscinibacter sakaiensis]|uniref:Methyltransferase n=1 Tax=Piscinibacter sakaiensis TaxID=1547922 RepID=A0A0K8P2N6_PISS1|nr:class I SAM-dependent methyltransferase [Piscinibacter sakaiensis]GAP36440.1 methyltransferase [Piscinibacter sakaiensis]